MRYTRFIIAIIALVASTSCVVDEIDNIVITNPDDDKIIVVGRVTRFDDHVVDTRGTKDSETEGKINNMAVAIFPVVDGAIGNCVFYEYKPGSEPLFTINRQIKDSSENYIYKTNIPYVMYVFANCPKLKDFNTTNTLAEMKEQVSTVSGIDIPANGFPMMGSLGDKGYTSDGDGKEFILKPGSDSNPGLPKIDNEESDLLTIPLAAMFAKVNFTIKVTSDQNIPDKLASRFVLNSYTVTNVPSEVDFSRSQNDDVDVLGSITRSDVTSSSNIAIGANTVTFSFYLPERYLTPAQKSHDGSKHNETGYYKYPFPIVDGKYRAEDLDLRQRFKPLLPSDEQNATYVTLSGVYRDHQNHLYDVNYSIYLGEDNYGNFDVQRNREYFNYITIRGISATNDMTDLENRVSIDHRVDVVRKSPVIISLRRETLLDSHIEVRPMRIRKSEEVDNMDELINAVKVEVVDPTTTSWMRLERGSGKGTVAEGKGIHITSGVSEGKRKYFTYNLVNGLSVDGETADTTNYSLCNSTSVVVPLNEAGESIWIYVDENTNTANKDGFRSGTLRVTCGVIQDNGTFMPTSVNGTVLSTDYVISQHALFPVTYNGHTYNIEYEEEYLHNFDAEDTYGQTEEEGMKWGLDGEHLSNEHQALYIKQSGLSGFTSIVQNVIIPYYSPYYDYYLPEDLDHVDDSVLSDENKKKITHDRQGFAFCNEIVAHLNGNDDNSDDISILDLATSPDSAIEYCLNRNKRNADGTISNVNWYLPAIDEMEDIVMGGYTDFIVFQAQDYWSSQPAYYQNAVHYNVLIQRGGSYMTDNPYYARATSVEYLGGGANNPLNYDIKHSKMNNYYQVLRINGLSQGDSYLSDIPNEGYSFRYLSTTYSYPKYSTDAGYQPRTEKNRIRCVRKM